MATGNTKTSSKFDHITSKVLIRKGSPSIYQLLLKKQNIGTLSKMTLGKKDPNKINKTILLVGGTGAGKSTLVNALVNYALGVKREDDVWFQIEEKKNEQKQEEDEEEEEEEVDQTQSQTTDVLMYEIFGFEDKTLPYSLTIIDTPGYGDVQGIEHDDMISKRLLDLFSLEEGVNEINLVGLVMKASVNRLDDRLRYIFDSLASLFGKNMEKNIVALVTHSDGLKPKNVRKALSAAHVKCVKDEKNEPIYFLFNNNLDTERTEEDESALKQAWTTTESQLGKFTTFLTETSPKKLKTTVEVLNTRIRLTACIQNLQERIEYIELQQAAIQQTKEGLKKHEEEMKNNKQFNTEIDEVYKDIEPIKGGMWYKVFYEGALRCLKCEENCHYPGCTKAWEAGHCEVMKRGRCTSCTGKCPASDHVKDQSIFVAKTRRVQKTNEDVKAKYENGQQGLKEASSLLDHLEWSINELQKYKNQWLQKSIQHVFKLDEIALNANSLSTHIHLDFLIERMKEKGDTENVRKLEEMKSRMGDGNRVVVWYKANASLESVGKALKGILKK